MPALFITRDDVRSNEIIALLDAHLTLMRSLSPPESVHALDLEGLRGPDITFWRAEMAGELVGCGALKELNNTAGEIKSMHTAAAHRGKGIAAALLRYVMTTARERGYQQLFLETGSQPGFEPARLLYKQFGFSVCPPFAGYVLDPNSVFMTIDL
ncbi:GNAT family N-acetyltransferase [Sneathiella litorea]|uniref:GNAT family N-acetyltransferase n=1 Tax=Sneathiella litorea TaxID=2606216 RepID=A0A6L8W9H3_9PROT|nr:GNAT family N-acetyltransferase [Sneathiella litorea]MZR31756.1 GNAT family N-acetyltransferase [Sneathiella litorea]